MEESLTIRSMRYDYKVSFVPDFRAALRALMKNESCVFLIDKNVWEVYDC